MVHAVGLKGTCRHCGEEVEIWISKKQLKAIWKSMKETSPAKAEMFVERTLGLDKKGDINI